MHRSRPTEDSARRWRRFCRRGWRLAGGLAALWLGGLALLFRVVPGPALAPRAAPVPARWWPESGSAALDVRALWSPAAFALATPAGFSHSLRRERIGLPPPVQAAPAAAAFLPRRDPPAGFDFSNGAGTRFIPAAPFAAVPPEAGVFPPRSAVREMPRLAFPEGWESRLFSGIDFNFGEWTNAAWAARVEMRFDARGVPVSMLVAQSSGLPEVDRRLARSANGWRLLEPAAPRAGTIEWISPAPAPSAATKGGPS